MALQVSYISLDALHAICKGDKDKKLKYLKQFLEMIPLSIQKLTLDIEEEDRVKLMKEIHFMSPQLVFFGIDDFSDLMKTEKEFHNLPFDVLKAHLIKALIKIESALKEVETIVENQSNSSIL